MPSSPSTRPVPAYVVMGLVVLLVQCIVFATGAAVGVATSSGITTAASALHHESSTGEKNISITSTITSTSSSSSGGIEATLTNGTVMTFLSSCDGKDLLYEKFCKLYRDLAGQLAKRKQDPVTVEAVRGMLGEKQDPTDDSHLCDNLTDLLGKMKESTILMDRSVKDSAFCDKACLEYNAVQDKLVPKPLCRVLLWGFRKLAMPDVKPASLEEQAAGVVMTPQLPKVAAAVPEEKKEASANPKQAAPAAVIPSVNTVTPALESKTASSKSNESVSTGTAAAPAPAGVPAASAADEAHLSKPIAASTEQQKLPALVTPKAESTKAEDVDLELEEAATENTDDKDARNDQILESEIKNGNVGGPEDENTGDYPLPEGDDDTDSGEDFPSESKPVKEANSQPDRLQKLPPVDKLPTSGDEDDQRNPEIEKIDPFFEEGDSNFFAYFMFAMFLCIGCYVAYHNKSKLLALALEGRRSSSGRGGFSKGGRKHTAAYRKLDSNLEEAITSSSAGSSRSKSQIIY